MDDEEIARIIERNKTWELYDPSKDVIGLKWVFKTKFKESSIQKHKACLVAKCYSQ